jgi:hypothetical protein
MRFDKKHRDIHIFTKDDFMNVCIEQILYEDPQAAVPAAFCPECGGELYAPGMHCARCGEGSP